MCTSRQGPVGENSSAASIVWLDAAPLRLLAVPSLTRSPLRVPYTAHICDHLFSCFGFCSVFLFPPFVSLASHLQSLPCIRSIGVHECAGRRRRENLPTCVFHLCWSSMFPVCLRAAVIYNVPCAPEVLKPPCCTVMNVRRSGTMCGLRNEMNGSGNTFCFQDTLLLLPVTYWSIVGFSKLPFPSRTLTNPLTRSTHTAHVWTLFPGEDSRNSHESLTSADNLNAWDDLGWSCTLFLVSLVGKKVQLSVKHI